LTDFDEFEILMNDIERIASDEIFNKNVKIVKKKMNINYEEFMLKCYRFTEINFSFQ